MTDDVLKLDVQGGHNNILTSVCRVSRGWRGSYRANVYARAWVGWSRTVVGNQVTNLDALTLFFKQLGAGRDAGKGWSVVMDQDATLRLWHELTAALGGVNQATDKLAAMAAVQPDPDDETERFADCTATDCTGVELGDDQ